MQRVPMTPNGYQVLQQELEQLKKIERPKVIEDIATARAHGDLSENAEYDAAKERQGFIEARIRELESKIGLAEVIDPATINSDKVEFGATVEVIDLDTDKKNTYTIVGDDEANPDEGKINVLSPLAKALIGKRVGDEAEFQAPGGERAYEILNITYG
ncbi:transcription elongation factor GreA-like [Ylistrum balloti]|uniref:transcription elongation factor GreA-like n=1 Tax=Ylistrum balloti TaxID=509963 RepID=UPI0029058DE6|nr:transcription elongation factor GreA-like [Ylistrum balloti]